MLYCKEVKQVPLCFNAQNLIWQQTTTAPMQYNQVSRQRFLLKRLLYVHTNRFCQTKLSSDKQHTTWIKVIQGMPSSNFSNQKQRQVPWRLNWASPYWTAKIKNLSQFRNSGCRMIQSVREKSRIKYSLSLWLSKVKENNLCKVKWCKCPRREGK